MNAEELKAAQGPLKQLYRDEPARALVTLTAVGTVRVDGITCDVDSHNGVVTAGLHPATGGDGVDACSGNMLLEALVACAGVTLKAVATAIGVELRSGTVSAEGDLDFRGTLGVSKEAPVGFSNIRLTFDFDTDASEEQVASLVKLTERYCVIYQTLKNSPAMELVIEIRDR